MYGSCGYAVASRNMLFCLARREIIFTTRFFPGFIAASNVFLFPAARTHHFPIFLLTYSSHDRLRVLVFENLVKNSCEQHFPDEPRQPRADFQFQHFFPFHTIQSEAVKRIDIGKPLGKRLMLVK
jgi:hypothetical protein